MTAATLDISNILTYLLKQAKISEAELSRKINLPRATINRLVSGKTPDPRASTLNAISQYFNVSVDQLLGIQPLILNEDSSILSNVQSCIPILEWNETSTWEETVNNIKPDGHYDWVMVDPSIDEGKFALRVKGEAMWPQFQENTILIINTIKEAKNRDFVIAYLKQSDEIIFRQLLIENKYKFLKAINNIFPSIKLEENDKIIGIVIQVRKNY
jgi:SOS-response transcriptional repressor LexA